MKIAEESEQRYRFASNRFRRLGGEFFWIVMGQVAAVVGALVGVRVLTGLLAPEAYGQLALGMTVATLVHQVVLGPLSGGAARFYAPAREAGALQGYLAAVRLLVFRATGGIVLGALLLGLGFMLAGYSKWIGFGGVAVCFAWLSGCNALLSAIQNAARERAIVALHQGLESWGRFLLAAALVLWLGATSTVAMLGYVLAMLIVFASQLRFFGRITRSSGGPLTKELVSGPRWENQMFTYAWPFATWGIFTWAQMVSDRWLLQIFSSTQDVGLYAVLYQFGYYPIFIAAALMVQLVTPVMFERAGDASSRERMMKVYALNWRLIYIGLGLTVLAFVVSAVCYDLLFRILVAPEYVSVAYLLPWMMLSGGLFATGQTTALSLMSSRKTQGLVLPKVATAVLGIGLNYVGVVLFGVPGVVGASVIFAAAYLVWILAITVMQEKQFAHLSDFLGVDRLIVGK